MAAIWRVRGLLVLALLAVDVLLTVFHPPRSRRAVQPRAEPPRLGRVPRAGPTTPRAPSAASHRRTGRQYPIPYYFRPAERSRSLPVQIGHLVELLRRIDAERAEPVTREIATDPSVDSLRTALATYLGDVREPFVPARFGSYSGSIDEWSPADAALTHRRLLGYMRYPPGVDRPDE